MAHDELVKAMRAMADYFEANPDLPEPYAAPNIMWGTGTTKDQLAQLARTAAKAGLPVKKEYIGSSFYLTIGHYPFQFEAYVTRDVVCRAVETGETKTVPVHETYKVGEKEVPVTEWVCDEPLLASGE